MEEEIMPYRKKAKKNTPKKYDHKHQFEPCVVEFMGKRLDKGHGFIPHKKTHIRDYCIICGKLQPEDWSRWWIKKKDGRYYFSAPTEEHIKELNPETRSLPTFWLDDEFQKHIDFSKRMVIASDCT